MNMMRPVCWILALGAPLLLAGCGKGGGTANALPDAGQMKIVSIGEVPSPEQDSLLINGDFDNTFAGAPYPEGVQVPDKAQSDIVAVPQAIKGIKSRYQLNQIWAATDENAAPDHLFGVFADGLQADASYKLHVVASGINGMTARLSVYEVTGLEYELVAQDVIVTNAGQERGQIFDGTFTTKKGGRIVVVTNNGPMVQGQARVVWHLWSLTPA